MTETHASGAGGSRSDVSPISHRAPRRRLGSWQRTSPRRLPKVLEVSDEEKALASFFANPTNEKLRKAHPLTRLEKYIAASPLVSAQLKGFVAVVAARCDPQSCDTIKFSYNDIARSIKSARKKTSPTSPAATVDRRTVINYGAELEALGMLETELRHPVTQRDPKHPKNLHNRFRFVFPPWAGPVAEAQRDGVDEDGVDERRRSDRASIEAEIAGREPQRVAPADVDVVAPSGDQLFFEQQAQRAMMLSQPKRPKPARDSAAASSLQPRGNWVPKAFSDDDASSTSTVPAAEREVRAASMREGIAAVLALYADDLASLPADDVPFAERMRRFAKQQKLSLSTALVGLEHAVGKINGRRGRELADFILACMRTVHSRSTLTAPAKQIVKRVEQELEAKLEALRGPARGRVPP